MVKLIEWAMSKWLFVFVAPWVGIFALVLLPGPLNYIAVGLLALAWIPLAAVVLLGALVSWAAAVGGRA
jgi:hypothetical protein